MTAFAFEGGVSSEAVQGGVEITDEQYEAAIAGMLNGKIVTVDGGFALVDPPEPPTPEPEQDMPTSPLDVDIERDRRTASGFTFAGVAYQLDEKSISRVTAMGADARFAVLGGAQPDDLRWADPDNDFGWIATDNSVTPMDAPTMATFADAAKLWVSQHIFAARALKNADPIPLDYASNPAYWPA